MYVILDIAANHTAWDHSWFVTNPEYYSKVEKGSIPWNPDWIKRHPEFFKFLKESGYTYPIGEGETDWWDTADLNYDNEDLREEMKNILIFWIEECNIDGYRCDVADRVPADFWEMAKESMDSVKPVFMLAEAEKPEHHNKAFDMSYSWELHHIFNSIARGEKDANSIEEYFVKQNNRFPSSAYRMNFITNHDENSWNGTVNERMGEGGNAFAVLSYTAPGMPLIYSGQEAGLNKRLEFFEKDQIDWNKESPLIGFYTTLNNLKANNLALWNGQYGGDFKRINIGNDKDLLAFIREKDNHSVLVVLNLSDKDHEIRFTDKDIYGKYKNVFFGNEMELSEDTIIDLMAWGYLVFEQNGE